MVTITANSTNILTQYTNDESCKATLKELKITSSCDEVRKVINAFDRDPIMVATILHESNFNKTSKNINDDGTVDKGVLQLNSRYYSANGNIDNEIKQGKENFEYFKRVTGKGYKGWASYNNGKYLTRMEDAIKLIENI